jgi:tetratricopeptide (TPR) repeat protein
MTELDLERDLPEDFEGRIVVIGGCRYRIGSLLGVGAEVIAHTLINCRSGLPLLVIKIPRDQAAALVDRTRVLQIVGKLKASKDISHLIPNQQLLVLHGGVFEVQDNGSSAAADPETSSLLDQAMTFFESKAYEEAQQIYTSILQRNPSDTSALMGSAAVLVEMGNAWDALPIMQEIIAIEPNFCGYYQSYISVLCRCPYPRAIIEIADRMKSVFPYQCAADDVIAEAYLECGQPQQARDLLTTSPKKLDPDRRDSLDKRVRLQLKGSKAAARFNQTAQRAIIKEKWKEAIIALERACRLDPYDPYSRANLAFTLRRTGEYKSAAALLSSLGTIISTGYAQAIHFNTGLALLQAGEKETAIKVLVSAVNHVVSQSDGPLMEADLPGVAIWIKEEYIQEERIRTAYAILAQLADATSHAETAWLLQQYAVFANET